jgi:hypothetical protein
MCLKQKIILDDKYSQYGNPTEIQFPAKLAIIIHRSGFFTRSTTALGRLVQVQCLF